ncbi:MAG: hypothetical protein ACRDKL_02405 [Solirubrobacteraceae bacterium]
MRTTSYSNLAVWFGVLGGPLAWAAQFVSNLFLAFFECGVEARASVPLHTLQIALGVAGLLVALASTAVATRLFRETVRERELSLKVIRGFGGEPPLARVHFLAIVGLTVNFLALAIIVMTTIGSPALLACRQS